MMTLHIGTIIQAVALKAPCDVQEVVMQTFIFDILHFLRLSSFSLLWINIRYFCRLLASLSLLWIHIVYLLSSLNLLFLHKRN